MAGEHNPWVVIFFILLDVEYNDCISKWSNDTKPMLVARGTQTKSTSRLTDREARSHNGRHGNAVEKRIETRVKINAI